jgi:hypothetical protein
LPALVLEDEVAEFLNRGVLLKGPEKSNRRREDDRRSEIHIVIESYRDMRRIYHSAPGNPADTAPRDSDLASIIGNYQTVCVHRHSFEASTEPVNHDTPRYPENRKYQPREIGRPDDQDRDRARSEPSDPDQRKNKLVEKCLRRGNDLRHLQLLFEHPVDHCGIGLAAARLHHLAD